MAKHERNRFVATYHALVAVLILLAGGALLGFGIWLHVTDNGGPLNLDYNGGNIFRIALNFSVGAMIAGGFLILTGIVSLIAMGRKCVGVTFRLVYVICALLIAAVMVLACVTSTLIVINGDNDSVKDFIKDAWTTTVSNRPDDVCSIESHFKCRGFIDNDCALCPTGKEPECAGKVNCASCSSNASPSVGCYDEILANARTVFLPMAIASGILAGIVMLDVFITCCL